MKSERRKFVNIPHANGWRNVELLKERGLIPYYMHKNHGFDSYMVGADIDDYTYIDEYLSGLEMEFLETGSVEEKIEYIRKNAAETDVLMLDSLANLPSDIPVTYKKINPKGKIYLSLDANSSWMDRIRWNEDFVMQIMESADVIATSCTAMQNHLNEKWPWQIYHIPNGYINLSGKEPPKYEEKQNIIMTCSRLGTFQKATDVLLEAFALAADKISDWSLCLVGSMEKPFEKFVSEYFEKYPHLKERVVFKGVITDKKQLWQEYFNAKIFALPSVWEGGCPNVVSEALYSGCAMAVTKFDAYEDCIDFGRCGRACDINNTAGFADIIIELAKSSELKNMCTRANEYAKESFDMSKIVDKLYELLFAGENEQ